MDPSSKARVCFYRMRGVAATLCIAVLAVLIGYKVVFGANGTMQWRAKRAEYQRLQREIEKAKVEHAQLEDHVRKLQSDPDTIVKEAREKLGYVMPGEVVLVQPQAKPDPRAISDIAENHPEASPKK